MPVNYCSISKEKGNFSRRNCAYFICFSGVDKIKWSSPLIKISVNWIFHCSFLHILEYLPAQFSKCLQQNFPFEFDTIVSSTKIPKQWLVNAREICSILCPIKIWFWFQDLQNTVGLITISSRLKAHRQISKKRYFEK